MRLMIEQDVDMSSVTFERAAADLRALVVVTASGIGHIIDPEDVSVSHRTQCVYDSGTRSVEWADTYTFSASAELIQAADDTVVEL